MSHRRLYRWVDRALTLPGIRHVNRRRFDRQFASAQYQNLFRGVYSTYEEAQASAPATKPLGYDHPLAAQMYQERTQKIFPSDYPVLFWLQRLFAQGHRRVFDVGGHVGVGYYAYQKYLEYPDNLSWCVHDVPAVNEQGRKMAADAGLTQLTFADEFGTAAGCDILFASGSIQYLPQETSTLLSSLASLPANILLNLTPVHPSQTFFTLQNIGTAFCPYRIVAEQTLVRGLTDLGYALVDQWDNLEKSCEVFSRDDLSLDRYRGYYFKRQVSR